MTMPPQKSPIAAQEPALTVLVVDDDEAVRDSLAEYLMSNGWQVDTAESAEAALAKVSDGIGDIVISDVRMPGMDGITLLSKLKALDPDIEVLITTGFSNESLAINALKAGAFDYFRKPLNGLEVATSLQRTRRVQQLTQENRRLKALLARVTQLDEIHSFVGISRQAQELLKRLEKVAASPGATVLLTGESGVGKEVAARMIHRFSRAEGAPFIAVNCGGLPESLLESELFGHERGAFTGAEKRVPGVFEMAMGGTVLLDEISEMSMQAQTRFLRILEDRRFMRLGGTREVRLEGTRIIAATNRDLNAMVDEGKFRRDLFFRISVAPIHIPPLRERPDDILPLAYHFLERFSKQNNRKYTLSPETERALRSYSFPGNARDMRNVIERACIFCETPVIRARDLGIPLAPGIADDELPDMGASANAFGETSAPAPARATDKPEVDEAAATATAPRLDSAQSLNLTNHEVGLICEALRRHPDNHSAAARSLGISPQTLYRKLEKYHLRRDGSSTGEPIRDDEQDDE